MLVTRLGIFTLFLFICPTCMASANNTNSTWTLTVIGDATTKSVSAANTTFYENGELQGAQCTTFNEKVHTVTCNATKSKQSFDPIYITISYTEETNNMGTPCVKGEDTTTSSPAVTTRNTASSTEIDKTDEAGIILVTAVLLLATSIMINVTGCWCNIKVFRRMDSNKSPKLETKPVKKGTNRRNRISASSFQRGRRAGALPQPPISVPSRIESAIYEEINF